MQPDLSAFQPDYSTWRDRTVERQRGGWKALFRRMAGSGLRIDFGSEVNDLECRVLKRDGSQYIKRADGLSQTALRTLRPDGLLFEILTPGSYGVELFRGKKLVRTIGFLVGSTMATFNGRQFLEER